MASDLHTAHWKPDSRSFALTLTRGVSRLLDRCIDAWTAVLARRHFGQLLEEHAPTSTITVNLRPESIEENKAICAAHTVEEYDRASKLPVDAGEYSRSVPPPHLRIRRRSTRIPRCMAKVRDSEEDTKRRAREEINGAYQILYALWMDDAQSTHAGWILCFGRIHGALSRWVMLSSNSRQDFVPDRT